jgi:hypothetical protein
VSPYPVGGGSEPPPTVKEAIEKFKSRGCKERIVADGDALGTDGEKIRIRYLYNPANDQYVYIQNFPDDDQPLAWSIFRNWERRLGLDSEDDDLNDVYGTN